jgi:metal-responsive CopG/Arc/MetJ family transcriptional regulator
MDKRTYSISLREDLVEQVKTVQTNVAGCSNLSAIVEKLLIQWLQQFEVQHERL